MSTAVNRPGGLSGVRGARSVAKGRSALALELDRLEAKPIGMKRKMAVSLLVTAFGIASAPPAFAAPKPPTQGGLGAGASGQCTGPMAERPASCGP